MTAKQQVISEVLRENYVLLTENLDCAELLRWLYNRKRISHAEKEDVEACNARHEKTNKLLDILGRKNDIALGDLLEFLWRDETQMELLRKLKASAEKFGYEWQLPVIEHVKITSKQVFREKWWPARKKLINGFLERRAAGGELLIKALRDQLHSSEGRTMAIVPQAQTIAGMGGVGKTSMAKWYGNFYEDQYDQIIWIDSEGQSLQTSFEDLATKLGISLNQKINEKTKSLLEIVQEIYEKLADCECLFIFDNVDEGYEKVKDFLPNGTHYVIITSRIQSDWGHANLHGYISTFSVEVFTKEECLALFRKAHESEILKGALPNEDEVEELSQLLGYLPLAMQCAIATITSQKSSFTFASYLARLRVDMGILTDKKLLGGEYTRSISVALRLSLEQIASDSESSETHKRLCKTIIEVAAYCNPDELFEGMFASLPNASQYQVQDAVDDLVKRSLLSIDALPSRDKDKGQNADRKLIIHRLLQEVMKQTLGQDSGQECEALRAALLCFQSNFEKCERSAFTTWKYAMKHDDILREGECCQFPVRLGKHFHSHDTQEYIDLLELSVEALRRIFKETDLPIIQHRIELAYQFMIEDDLINFLRRCI